MPETALKAALKLPIVLFRKQAAKYSLSRLTSHPHPRIRAVGLALQESLAQKFSDEERAIISQIEERRASLLGSDQKITVIDYGAGDPQSRRTKDEMEKGVRSAAMVADLCKASKPAFWAAFLFKLIRKLEPSSCVELGACVGISASYQAAALRLNGKGRLTTLEGSPETANVARETLKHLNLENAAVVTGPFHETLPQVLESSNPIDYFFNDGHHDHDAVIRYFNESLPYVAKDAVVVFDDISWSPGMRKAWAQIEADNRVAASVDLHTIGIAVMGRGIPGQTKLRIPL